MDPKARLRKAYKQKRKDLGADQRRKYSHVITNQAFSFLEGKPEVEHMHLFLPIDRLYEINTFPLLDQLLAVGKNVYTSISDFDSGEMKTVKLLEKTLFTKDQWGIPIPDQVELVEKHLIQLVFVPLLAYDLKGNRIGYGKGFYDRFLKELSPLVEKVGLSFFPPEKMIEIESHDISLDSCITPDEIITFS
ncbi:5-formyltetrahydrofolate cyclo-ligase [Echinicola jeungdonensis]|uniref:5-formyltetrahydrofolate cyclo-ligase n=1 Tax=Echinicola jeungdonensis TaxID=709343 RepID=A0ABV5J558_9BACT|nr:5-formyltetrahydrofolate cyclo-ligase [Echinicola jeungdonensis]MDN3668858.1 5-formyltetrahydrofolate cyclo-ligase [Echinicola jeungdonensis]